MAAAADRRYMAQDERGSVIAMSDSNGASLGINSYDEYGNPGGTLTGRYGFTGQAWIASAQLWYLNARMYSSAIGGRFLQTDPIGYAGGINLYAYVGNDPVNWVDPLGLGGDEGINVPPCPERGCPDVQDIFVTGVPLQPPPNLGADQLSLISFTGPGDFTFRGPAARASGPDVIVTGVRPIRVNIPPLPLTLASSPLSVSPMFLAGARQPRQQPQRYNPKRNYCGAEGGVTVPQGDWNEACYKHDVCYATAGANKVVCDVRLSGHILALCISDIWLPPVCALPAAAYGAVVTFFGWGPYRRGQGTGP